MEWQHVIFVCACLVGWLVGWVFVVVVVVCLLLLFLFVLFLFVFFWCFLGFFFFFFCFVLFCLSEFVPGIHHLVGLVVKASASWAADPGFDSRLLRRGFVRVESCQ